MADRRQEKAQPAYVDPGKRIRLILIALLIAVSVFILRAGEYVNVDNLLHMSGVTLGYFVSTYLLLIWGLRFQVNKRSLLYVIPQSALYVATQVLFVMMFFFTSFERAYEFVLLFAVLSFVISTTYVSFLMTNVFNVATFKDIPLIRVAKTSSYLITLLTTYFMTFAIISSSMPYIWMGVILFVLYFVIILFHFIHLDLSNRELWKVTSLTAVAMISIVVAGLFLGSRHEMTALLPVSVAFGAIGLEMQPNRNDIKWWLILEYGVLIGFVVFINILFQ